MLVFLEGFEHYGTNKANLLKGAWAQLQNDLFIDIVSSPARTGSRALHISSGVSLNTVLARYALKTATDLIGVGFGIYLPNLPGDNTNNRVVLRDASNISILSISFNSDGSLSLYKGGMTSTDLIETSDSYLTAGTYHHVEFRAFIDDTVGEFELRVNGITAIQLGGLDLGTSPAKGVGWGNVNGGVDAYYDDIFIWNGEGEYNNDFLGPLRVLTVYADEDGSPQNWSVIGAATAHEAVDETSPDGDSSYVGTDTIGDKCTLVLPELPAEVSQIAGIYVPVYGRIEEAGTAQINVSAIRDGQSYYGGETTPLTSSYTYWPFVFDYDPSTELPWDKAGFEDAEIQLEKTA